MRKLLALFLALGLLVSACGSSDDGGSDTTTAPTGADPTTAGTEAPVDTEAPVATDAAPEATAAPAAGGTAYGLGGDPGEFTINGPTEVAAGSVTFTTTNDGAFPHHLAISRGDSYDTLPQLENGAVDEAALGDDYLGRTDNLGAGEAGELTVDLDAGNYVLFCNVQGGGASHAGAGQVLSITVA